MFQGGLHVTRVATAFAGQNPDTPVLGGQASRYLLTRALRVGSLPDDDQDLQVLEALVEHGSDGPFQVRTGPHCLDDDAESGPVHGAQSRAEKTSTAHVLLPRQQGTPAAPEPCGINDGPPLEQERIEIGELLVADQHHNDVGLLDGLSASG